MNFNRAITCRACFTIIRAVTPPELSKSFRLEHDELISHAAAHMVEGVAYRRCVEDVAGLARLFAQMTIRRDWALCSGITQYDQVRVVTKRELAHVEGAAVARSKAHLIKAKHRLACTQIRVQASRQNRNKSRSLLGPDKASARVL